MSGTQWPPAISGSVHSMQTTLGGFSSVDAAATTPMRSRIWATVAAAPASQPVARPARLDRGEDVLERFGLQ